MAFISRRHISLKWRTILAVSLAIALITGVSTVWTVYHAYNRDMAELNNRGRLLAEMQAGSLSQPMWDLNQQGVQALISSLEKDHDFQQASVLDKEGKVVEQFIKEKSDSDSLSFEAPIIYSNQGESHVLGKLRLVLGQSSLRQAQRETLISGIETSLLLLFATVAIVSFVLSYLIIRPIRELTNVIGKISQGNLDQVIPLKRLDELGVMVTAFNTMTKTLAKNYRMIEERTNELIDTNEKLENAKTEAESANRIKSQFLANMSHELRTPLNAIIGYSEMLIEEAADLSGKQCIPDLERIVSSARHLLKLISDVLDLSKIEAGKMTTYLEKFNLPKMISEVKTLINPLMLKGNNRFEVHIDNEVNEVCSDEMKLRQAVINLLGNAAKFTQNGNISLNVKRETANDNDWVIISVQDTGIGMTEQQMAKIFDAFTQADESTTRRYGGTGLGLAITKKTCNLLGGDVNVNSRVGEGSTFSIRVPINSKKNPVLL